MKVVVAENFPREGVYTGEGVSLAFGSAGSGNTLPGPEFPISSDREQHTETPALPDTAMSGVCVCVWGGVPGRDREPIGTLRGSIATLHQRYKA